MYDKQARLSVCCFRRCAHKKKFTTNRFVRVLTWDAIKSTLKALKANGMFPWRCQPRRNERIKFNGTGILHEYAVKRANNFKECSTMSLTWIQKYDHLMNVCIIYKLEILEYIVMQKDRLHIKHNYCFNIKFYCYI